MSMEFTEAQSPRELLGLNAAEETASWLIYVEWRHSFLGRGGASGHVTLGVDPHVNPF